MEIDYHTPQDRSSWLARHMPGIYFYSMVVLDILAASRRCKKNTYSTDKKIESSANVLRTLERIGVEFVIENMSAFIDLKTPCVFVANHMSVLETFVLPCFIMPYRKITFVLKRSLTQYPIYITGNGRQEHQKIIQFIEEKLNGWAD